jgi:cysteine desulfurase
MQFRRRTYLDAAAGFAGSPSSPHAEGRAKKKQLEDARTAIARLLEVKADDIIFTSGATEANALAVLGVVRAAKVRRGKASPHVLYLPSAHASVVQNVEQLAREGVLVEPLPLSGASVDVQALARCIRPETVLVAMDAVCGETGVVWNTREVADVLHKARPRPLDARIYLHVDASQAALTTRFTRAHFAADLLTLDGGKVGATHRIGCLSASRTIPLTPLYYGGGQERSLRPGTEDAIGAQSFADMLGESAAHAGDFAAVSRQLRALLIQSITAQIQNVYINESPALQAPHIVNVSFLGRDTDYLVALLDEAGFAVSTKSACETDSEEGSRAVYALFGDAERAKSTLRISWNRHVRSRDVQAFARALKKAVAFVDSSTGG